MNEPKPIDAMQQAQDAQWLAQRSTNLVLDRLSRGEPVLALGIRHSRTIDIVKIAQASGHHAIWVDLEHSAIPLDLATQMCSSALDLGIVPFVRIPEREYGAIGRLLDGGALGIIAPRIETVEQARDVAAACRFPPLGRRSQIGMLPHFGMQRVAAGILNRALNGSVAVQVLIETPTGIDNIEAIAGLDGVDMVSIGTNDLSAELGVPGDYRHPRVREAHLHAIACCKRAGKCVAIGGIGDVAYVAELVALGAAPLLFSGIDGELLRGAAQQAGSHALQALQALQAGNVAQAKAS